jgi:hypothetical protein
VAQAVSYLSNATMGDMWMNRWCYGCEHDHTMSHDLTQQNQGCDIILRMMMGDDAIEELTEQNHTHTGWGPCCLHCSAFTPCTTCGVPATYDPKDHP